MRQITRLGVLKFYVCLASAVSQLGCLGGDDGQVEPVPGETGGTVEETVDTVGPVRLSFGAASDPSRPLGECLVSQIRASQGLADDMMIIPLGFPGIGYLAHDIRSSDSAFNSYADGNMMLAFEFQRPLSVEEACPDEPDIEIPGLPGGPAESCQGLYESVDEMTLVFRSLGEWTITVDEATGQRMYGETDSISNPVVAFSPDGASETGYRETTINVAACAQVLLEPTTR